MDGRGDLVAKVAPHGVEPGENLVHGHVVGQDHLDDQRSPPRLGEHPLDPQGLQEGVVQLAEGEIEPLLHLAAQLEALGVVAGGATAVAPPG